MLIKDGFVVNAPVETVWALLHDIPRLSACVPGVEEVQEIEPDVYQGRLRVKVGPLTAAFGGCVTIVERVAPELLAAQVEGEDRSSASFVKATFSGRLTPVETGTQLDYEMDLALRGRLAQFGLTVVQGTAKKMTAEFAKRLREALAE
jgi:carbon monoxide dehydrogenase subunit G